MFKIVLTLLFVCGITMAAQLPRENVIDIPAISEDLCVHNAFQSNMVIQRGKPVKVWGWAAPGEKVTVEFAGSEKTAIAADDRLWKVELPALEANSTPGVMVIAGAKKNIKLENILVGDVWVLGGQSNMEFPVAKVQDGDLELTSAKFKNIRVLTVPAQNGPKYKKSFPALMEYSDWSKRHFRKGYWDECSPEIVKELSAIGYAFAKRLHMAVEVPIGVVDASRGGTTVESWTPRKVLEELNTKEINDVIKEWDDKVAAFDPEEDLKNRIKKHEQWVERMKKAGKPANKPKSTEVKPGPDMNQNMPGNNFASMIAPVAGFQVKGVIFHQGFNNAFRGSDGVKMYYQVFGKMITAWRKAFEDPELPFGIISLCTAGAPQTLDDYCEKMVDTGVYLRHVQYKTFLDFYSAGDKNIGFASSFDKRRSWYHPHLKFPVGERIARWALATQYGQRVKWKPPVCTKVEHKDGKLELKFDERLRVDDSGEILGFAIAGENKVFHPAKAEFFQEGKNKDSSLVTLSSPMVGKPIHYRYAWSRSPLGNVYVGDQIDVPLATQRTDDWYLSDIAKAVLDNKEITSQLDRKQKGALMNAMKNFDLMRRIKEAQTLLKENSKLVESLKK